MTGPEFSGVDIDLLADYVGGALDGTPDETAVAALIADDPAWQEAYTELAGGVAVVTGHLQQWGAVAEPMPADVVARLDAALLIADDASGATVGADAMEPGSDGAAPVRHLVAVPSSGSGSKRARRLRWAAPIGIAAGVLAFAGFGLQQQFADSSSDTATSSAGGSADQAAPQAAGAAELSLPSGPVPLSESGTDYRRGTLVQAARERTMLAPQLDQEPSGSRKAVPSAGMISAGDPALDRLRAQDALQKCIDAIAASHGAGEITAQTIDFARYDGSPAVVVTFLAAGESWVWASGPACGTQGVGADKLASVKVG